MVRQISQEELGEHTTIDDLWVQVHGRVYDVSTFMHEHPGGPHILLEAVKEGDATALYERDGIGHSDKARELAEEHFIGVVKNYKGKKWIRMPTSAQLGQKSFTGQEKNTVSETTEKFDTFGWFLVVVIAAFVIYAYLSLRGELTGIKGELAERAPI